MIAIFPLIFLLLCLLVTIEAKSSTGSDVLVVVDAAVQGNYSIFFDDLKEQGYDLFFRSPKDEKPLLIEDDVPQFSHVLLLASDTKNFAKDITPQNIVQLLTLNTNVLIALSPKQNVLSSLASEFSLIIPPPATSLISHFPERGEPPSLIPVTVPSSPLLTPNTSAVWFSGVPFALGNNPLLVPILKAPAESFAADLDSTPDSLADASEKGGEGLWAGSQLGLVAGFQPLNGARALFVGSSDLFSDNYIKKELPSGLSGNKQFSRDISAWTFQESLVLRIDETTHHLVNRTEPEEYYTINDNIVYTTHISKYNPATGEWEPYSDLTDLQLEFTMLDPHIRISLPPVPSFPGSYSVTFRAPDRHGVFKFVLNHKRKGWTHIQSSITVPVVPPRHDGYPRFLSAAWPYYVGAISTSVGFVLFSALWLAGDVGDGKKRGKTE